MHNHQRCLAIVGVLACLLSTACTTTLNAVRLTDTNAEGVPPPAGAPYSLPFTQFTITVTRRLESCLAEDKKTPEAVIRMSAAVETSQVPDPFRQYVIDLSSLQGMTKRTDLTVEYHSNGALKSINAEAEDRTAPVIDSVTDVLGTVIKAANAAAAGRSPFCIAGQGDADGVVGLVEVLMPEQEKAAAAIAKRVAEGTTELERETTLAATLGRSWTAADRERMAQVVRRLSADRDELAKAKDTLAESLAKVTVVGKAVWPPDGSTFASPMDTPLVPGLTEKQIRAWLLIDKADVEALTRETAAHARIVSRLPQSAAASCSGGCPGDAVDGIKYRVPQLGTLQLYARVEPIDPITKQRGDAVDVPFANHAGLVAQLGPVYAIPLKSVPFSNRKVSATFTEAGLPVSIGIKSNAVAEAMTASIASTVTQAAEVRSSVITTELERVQARTALLVAQRNLQVAEAALLPASPSPTAQAIAAFQADAALANAELAYLNALRALEEARRLPQPGGG